MNIVQKKYQSINSNEKHIKTINFTYLMDFYSCVIHISVFKTILNK